MKRAPSYQFTSIQLLISNALLNEVNGGWGSWSKFGACSQSCGVGHRIRYRQCTHPEPANGGEPCFGLSSENMICNSHKCPGKCM